MNKIIVYLIWWIGLITGIFLTHFDLIGEMNGYFSPKREKIYILKKKIFIPYHGCHFFRKIKGYNPTFDGYVFKITYILTILNYIHFLIAISLAFLQVIFLKEWLFWVLISEMALISGVILTIFKVVEVRHKKREKESGLNFKM